MSEVVESVRHKKKESTLKWFVLVIIPIVNIYFLWRLAEMVAAHEKVSETITK